MSDGEPGAAPVQRGPSLSCVAFVLAALTLLGLIGDLARDALGTTTKRSAHLDELSRLHAELSPGVKPKQLTGDVRLKQPNA